MPGAATARIDDGKERARVLRAAIFRAACTFMAALVFGALAAGCSIVPRARTLPPHIDTVYVPMFKNRTAEPGLEEYATRATQREFMADGRLRLEQQERANAWVECTIDRYGLTPAAFESDDFPSLSRMYMRLSVRVRENAAKRPLIGEVRRVVVEFAYPSDMRRSIATLEPDAREQLMEEVGRAIVREVLTGEYGEATYTAPTSVTPAEENFRPGY